MSRLSNGAKIIDFGQGLKKLLTQEPCHIHDIGDFTTQKSGYWCLIFIQQITNIVHVITPLNVYKLPYFLIKNDANF